MRRLIQSAVAAVVLSQLLSYGVALPHEQITGPPHGWKRVGSPSDDQVLKLQISLAQSNVSYLSSTLQQISDPDSPCYGKYLDRDEVYDLFKPTAQARTETWRWLLGSGLSARDIVERDHAFTISTTVRHASFLLNTTFSKYSKGDRQTLRTTEYYLPDGMDRHVHFVSPTIIFEGSADIDRTARSNKRSAASPIVKEEVGQACQQFWTPSCLQELYNVKDYVGDPNSGSCVAWGAFLNISASRGDVEQYEDHYGLPRRGFSTELVNGGLETRDSTNYRAHLVDMDAFNIVAITGGQLPMKQYVVGGTAPHLPNVNGPIFEDDSNEPYLALYEHMLSKTNADLPQVITVSYSDDEQTVPRKYAERVCNSIGMLGLRGISVIQTMGGVGPGTACLSNDGTDTPQFTPQFPASCPYITSVGETNQTNPLMTWNITSGGFSFYFERPWYQLAAVDTYLNSHISQDALEYYSPFINVRGRASPDLSLQGYSPEFQVCGCVDMLAMVPLISEELTTDKGLFNVTPVQPSGGTRGNAAWAALVGLLNDARFRAGLPSMGFMNPWLYKYGVQGLTDITLGASIGCTGRNLQHHHVIPGAKVIPYVSWNATEGWDPATGLGFPDFQKLLNLSLDVYRGPDRCSYDLVG
jgi:tripeptidyl-peptidase I